MNEIMNHEKSESGGFWVRLWMEYGRGNTTKEETYEYLKYDDGYSDKDEDGLKAYAENWAQFDQDGWRYERYRYGFEVVKRPPNDWLEKELKRIIEEIKLLNFQKTLIELELEKG